MQPLNIAVPWSLSHYIPLDGFTPRYRALFDHAPENIRFSAWDNVNLGRKLRRNVFIRKWLLDSAKREAHHLDGLAEGSVARRYKEHFWAPNQILTAELPGEIEFHHTALFPSLKRPFIFHCETFEEVFTPFVQEDDGIIQDDEELREHYRSIFSNPLCLGIFSHVPETLQVVRDIFSVAKKQRFHKTGICGMPYGFKHVPVSGFHHRHPAFAGFFHHSGFKFIKTGVYPDSFSSVALTVQQLQWRNRDTPSCRCDSLCRHPCQPQS